MSRTLRMKSKANRLPVQSDVVDPAVGVDLAGHVVPLRKTAANGGEQRLLEDGLAEEADGKSAAAEIDFFACGKAVPHFSYAQVSALG